MVSDEIAQAQGRPGPRETRRLDFPPYRSWLLRHPTKALRRSTRRASSWSRRCSGRPTSTRSRPTSRSSTTGEPIGERHRGDRPACSTATVARCGTSWSRSGRPTRPGATATSGDQHPAPLDPHFTGVGRCLTDDDGAYRFTTIKPGPYPWRNHHNAWRPAHIHFSLFGTEFTQRLVTQMYFPGDPLFALDPIYQSITDPAARDRLVAAYDHDLTEPEWATGYRWDIVLTGTPRHAAGAGRHD